MQFVLLYSVDLIICIIWLHVNMLTRYAGYFIIAGIWTLWQSQWFPNSSSFTFGPSLLGGKIAGIFHDLRGKLFTEELLSIFFKGLENVNITYSTGGCDSQKDCWGYIQDGPSVDLSCDKNSLNPLSISKDRYKMMFKNLEYVLHLTWKKTARRQHLIWLCQ